MLARSDQYLFRLERQAIGITLRSVIQRKTSLVHTISLRNMKPLATNEQALIWLRAYTAPKQIAKWKKTANTMFALFALMSGLAALSASAAFFVRFVSTDLADSLNAAFQMSASFPMSYTIVATFFLRHRTTAFFSHLAEIYETCEKILWKKT